MKSYLFYNRLQCSSITVMLALLLLLARFATASASPREQTQALPTTQSTAPIEAKSTKVAALTEAKFLLGEGDRAASKAAAREKWLAAAAAFVRAGDQLGVADAYLRLADSYQIEAVFSRQKMQLAVGYYLKALTAGADVYESLIKEELTFDNATLTEAETLYTQGQAAYDAGNCQQAISLMDQARRLYRRADLGSGEVRALTIKAICQMEAENYFGSLTTLLEGLLIAQSLPLGDQTTERYLEGQEEYKRGNFTVAEAIYQEVLATYKANNDQGSIAEVTLDLGTVYAQMGNYAKAEEWFEAALPLFVALDNDYDQYNEAATRHNLANLAIIDGRYADAVTGLNTALTLWQSIGDPVNEVASLSSLGLALRGRNEFENALAVLEAAWAQQQQLSPDVAIEGDIRNNIGVVYHAQGKFSSALAEFEQAQQIREDLTEPQRSQKLFESQNNIAAVYADLSRFDDALRIYAKLLAQLPATAPATLTAPLHANMAAIYVAQGDYQRGIATYVDVLPTLDEQQMTPAQTSALQNLGAAYLRTGKLAEGERYLVQAQTIFSTTGDLAAVAAIDNNLGLAYAQTGHYVEATNYFTKALTVWQAQDNQSATAKTLANLALVAAAQDDLPAAIAYGEEALTLSEQTPVPADQARIAIILSILSLKGEAFNEAIGYGEQAIALSQQIADPVAELGGYLILAAAHYLTDDFVAADEAIRVAIERLEALQGRLTVAQLKTAFLDQIGGVYDLAVLIALANQEPEQAFFYAEQARARAFLDQLVNVHIDFRQGTETAQLQREQTLRQQMVDLQNKINVEEELVDQQQREHIDAWKAELEATRRQHAQLLLELQVSNPAYVDLMNGKVLSLADIQRQIVDEQSTLIVYFLPDVTFISKPLAWVIAQNRAELVPLEVNTVDIESQTRYLRNLLVPNADGAPLEIGETTTATTALYRNLFAPLVPSIQQRNIIIAPHAALHYLPFAALQNPETGQYLLEEYTITYTPSASALQYIRKTDNWNEEQLLALGNPDGSLPFAESEAEQVAALYASKPLLGQAATESRFLTQAPKADLLHLAAHGVYDSLNPFYTRIELAPDAANDGHVEVHELFGLDLSRTNLVVLSACETALGEQSRGDELVGLTRAFFQAGAPAVVTSLWNVDDASTETLMVQFYQQMQTGMTPADALRTAQLAVLAQEQWQSPYYWAAFLLNGDDQGGGTNND